MSKKKIQVLPLVRNIIVFFLLAVMIFSAVMATVEFYDKQQTITFMYEKNLVDIIAAYGQTFSQRFNPNDMAALKGSKNIDALKEAMASGATLRNQKDWFKEDYIKILEEAYVDLPAGERNFRMFLAKNVDSRGLFDMYLGGFLTENMTEKAFVSIIPVHTKQDSGATTVESDEKMTALFDSLGITSVNRYTEQEYITYDPETGTPDRFPIVAEYRIFATPDQIEALAETAESTQYAQWVDTVDAYEVPFFDYFYERDVRYVTWIAILFVAFILLLVAYAFIRPRALNNCFLPKGERSSLGNMPAYLANVLSCLTCGIFGLFVFFSEKKSRYVRMIGVQSLLTGLIALIGIVVTALMTRIFTFMFEQVAVFIGTVQIVTAVVMVGALLFSLVAALCRRVFTVPVVGRLSLNSSYID